MVVGLGNVILMYQARRDSRIMALTIKNELLMMRQDLSQAYVPRTEIELMEAHAREIHGRLEQTDRELWTAVNKKMDHPQKA